MKYIIFWRIRIDMIDLLLRYYNFGFDHQQTKLPQYSDEEIYAYYIDAGEKVSKTAKYFKCATTTVKTAVRRLKKEKLIE